MTGDVQRGDYRDADGATHHVFVRQNPTGDWQVLDSCGDHTHVIDTLDCRDDGRPQAEAVARDYITTVTRFAAAARQGRGEPISEQGGPDDHSDRRPRRRAHKQARRPALSRPAR